jgi:hypothetical protein
MCLYMAKSLLPFFYTFQSDSPPDVALPRGMSRKAFLTRGAAA